MSASLILANDRKRHGRVEIMTTLGDALTDRAGKIFEAVGADAGFRVGSNVGAVNPPKRSRHRKAPGEFLAARTGVTGATIGRPAK